MRNLIKLSITIFITTYAWCQTSSLQAMSIINTNENDTSQTQSLSTHEISESAKADANDTFQQGDTRLLAFVTRARDLPGIEASLHAQAKQKCGIKDVYSKDTVTSKTQLSNLKHKITYITAYNKAMFKLCMDGD